MKNVGVLSMNEIDEQEKLTAELYEIDPIPGNLLGLPVLDKAARMVGIVRNVKLNFLPFKVELVIKGLDVEMPIDSSQIEQVGTVVRLSMKIKTMETVEVEEISKLRRQLREEIIAKIQSQNPNYVRSP
jgi:hypothetical protein